MTYIERTGDVESGISSELPRIFFGEDDTPELWARAGLRLPDAHFIAGAESSNGNLRPVLEDGITVVLQRDSKNALILRGAVDEEDHISLSSVAAEAASKRGNIPELPEIPGTSWNGELDLKVRRDWQNAFTHLIQGSETAKKAIQNSGAWLILDSKEELKGFSLAESEWEKEMLEAELLNLDEDFGNEVKGLRRRFVDSWKGVGAADPQPIKVGKLSRVFSGMALASTLPFNPAIQEQLAPIVQPADQETQAMLSEMLQIQAQQSGFYPENLSSRYSRMGSTGMVLELYENYFDELIPDTPPEQVNKAKEVLGIDAEAEVQGGFSDLAEVAYNAVLARGGTEEEVRLAVKAAGMGYYQSPDGKKWFHVYGEGTANLEEVTRDIVEKNTTIKAMAEGLRRAQEQGFWGDAESVGGTPVSPTQQPFTPTETVPTPEEAYRGSIAIANDQVEQDFLKQHTEFNADDITPIAVTVSEKNFELVEIAGGKYYMNIDGIWKELYRVEQMLGEDNFVVLQHLPRVPQVGESVQLESVLWYPVLTDEQWKAMTPEQRAQPWIHFAPPSEMVDELSGYNRDEDQGIPVFLSPDIVVPNFLVSLELKNTNFIVSDSPATQIPPSESILGTPEPSPIPEIKEFQQCDADHWKDCYVPIEDLGINGDYYNWLSSVWKPNLSLPDPNRDYVDLGNDGTMFYINTNRKVSTPVADRPYTSGFTYGYTKCGVTWGGVSHEMTCAIVPIAISVPDKPGEIKIILGLIEQGYNQPDSDVTNMMNAIQGRGILMLWGYKLDPASGKAVLAGGDTFDIMQKSINYYPDIIDRINKFQQTLDPTWISEPGLFFGVNALVQ